MISMGGHQAQAIGVLEPRGEHNTQTTDQDSQDYTAADIKSMVEDEFGEDHPMVAVARCESSFRQYEDGSVLRNPKSDAIGIFQILEGLHEEPADKLGIDIFTADGNIDYARKLYDSFGLAPWSPSSLCWDDGSIGTTNPSNVDVETEESTRVPVQVRSDGGLKPVFQDEEVEQETDTQNQDSVDNRLITKKLVSGVRDPQVRDLQRLLNALGYRLSLSGPGSPGQETNFFGAKTRAAVKEFQCDQEIVCSGGRYSTGYGLVDQETRLALNKAAEGRDAGVYRIGDLRVRTKDSSNDEDSTNTEETSNDTSDTSTATSQDVSDSSRSSLQKDLAKAKELVSQLAAQINN
jgi:hypothetical protein